MFAVRPDEARIELRESADSVAESVFEKFYRR